MKNKGLRSVLVIVIVVIAIGILWYGWQENARDKMLTLEGAKETIELRYGGYVSSIQLVDDQYVATLISNNSMYNVVLAEDTGETLSYSQIENTNSANNTDTTLNKTTLEEKISTVAPGLLIVLEQIGDLSNQQYKAIVINGDEKHELDINASTNEIISHDVDKEKEISEPSILGKQAVQIAKNEVDGVVMDIDFDQETNIRYYEIDIVTAEKRKGEVKINADTGEVMTIEWDKK